MTATGRPGLTVLGTTAGSGKSLFVRSFAYLRRRSGGLATVYKPVALALNPIPEDVTVDRSVHLMALAAGAKDVLADRVVGHTAVLDGDDVLIRRAGALELLARSRRLSEDAVDFSMLSDSHWHQLAENLRTDLAAASGFLLTEGAGAATDAVTRDLSNMLLAEAADRPVLLVAGARKGGWPSSLVGTRHLMPEAVSKRVCGFVVNGVEDADSARAAVRRVEEQTGWPCLGIVPLIPLYADLPSRGSDSPVLDSWEEEIAAVADFLPQHLDPAFLAAVTSGHRDG